MNPAWIAAVGLVVAASLTVVAREASAETGTWVCARYVGDCFHCIDGEPYCGQAVLGFCIDGAGGVNPCLICWDSQRMPGLDVPPKLHCVWSIGGMLL